MKKVVITGANRGIGLAMTTQFKNLGFEVIALCRQASPQLNALGVTVITGIDVATSAGRQLMVKALNNIDIDILINNAGILRDESLGALNSATIIEQFEVNALAPIQVVDLLSTQLVIGAKIVLITSRMGSVTDNTSGGRYGYRMSKAALNIAGMSLAQDLAGRDISVGLYHPGYVQTEMVGNNGDISATEAATRLVGLINQQDMSQTGLFKHSNGEILPW
ncbi:MAG: SDR family NAD(P)-dependent oxidoreductase [Gammaproteobacteria bacterium]|nr:SDR family NAD(P)-dependent oxidoreductase [Gammaproteobacteria bacterium]